METWLVYFVTVEPGPRSPGENVEHYVDLCRAKLPIQEQNAIGDTVFRKFLGTVVARDVDEAFRKAEKIFVGQ
jgi:hypothetical protein